MKNRKFIGDSLQSCGWEIETYTSKILEGKPCFYAEFSYSSGYHTIHWDLKDARILAEQLTKFINEATKKEYEFNEKHKKKGKK